MNFLENTLLKRKSLINKESKRYKEIRKRKDKQRQNKLNSKIQVLKCPVYGCFKEVHNDEGLMKHYAEAHQDLKALGLDLVLDQSNI